MSSHLPRWIRALRIPFTGVVLSFVGFVVLNRVAFYFQFEDGVSIFYPPTAVDVVGCMYFGIWGAIGVFLGALATPWLPTETLSATAISGLLNVAEGMIPYLVFRYGRRLYRDLHDLRSLFAFLLFGTILNSAVSAFMGNLFLVPRYSDSWLEFRNVFMWWISDFSAALMIATPILAFASVPLERLAGRQEEPQSRTLVNALEVTAAVILLGWLSAALVQSYIGERVERDEVVSRAEWTEAGELLTRLHQFYISTHRHDSSDSLTQQEHARIRDVHVRILDRLAVIGADGGGAIEREIQATRRLIGAEPLMSAPVNSNRIENAILTMRAAFEARDRAQWLEHTEKRRRMRLVILLMNQMLLAILLVATANLLFRISRPLRQIRSQVARLQRDGTFDPARIDTRFVELQTLVETIDQTSRDLRVREDALREQTARAVAASKAKSEFLAKMSHELRTPMNSIIGFAEVLQERKETIEPARRDLFLDNILRSARNLLRLINDLLDVARVESGKLKFEFYELDLRYVLDRTLSVAQPLFDEKQQHVEYTTVPQPILVRGDSGRLEQVFLNLLTNAQKFSPRASTISLAVSVDGEFCDVRVVDSGIGIDAENQDFIFEEFAQVRQESGLHPGGTGLGLALARTMVEAHGGTIGVESSLGKGACFRVRLPLSREAEPAVASVKS
ncbi:MAG: sensor histidine kinase [Thermoanaerobaculia bacterium]